MKGVKGEWGEGLKKCVISQYFTEIDLTWVGELATIEELGSEGLGV